MGTRNSSHTPLTLLALVVKNENGCWEIPSLCFRQGYHPVRFRGIAMDAHRVFYKIFNGELSLEPGMHIDHLCRNRGCVNPEHLEQVTNVENIMRGYGPAAINARKTHCRYGHELNFENTYLHKKKNGKSARYCKACRKASDKIRKSQNRRSKVASPPIAVVEATAPTLQGPANSPSVATGELK